MNSSGLRTRRMSACTALNAGIVMITRTMSSSNGSARSRQVAPKRAWIYFNNDNDAYAPKNAMVLRRL